MLASIFRLAHMRAGSVREDHDGSREEEDSLACLGSCRNVIGNGRWRVGGGYADGEYVAARPRGGPGHRARRRRNCRRQPVDILCLRQGTRRNLASRRRPAACGRLPRWRRRLPRWRRRLPGRRRWLPWRRLRRRLPRRRMRRPRMRVSVRRRLRLRLRAVRGLHLLVLPVVGRLPALLSASALSIDVVAIAGLGRA